MRQMGARSQRWGTVKRSFIQGVVIIFVAALLGPVILTLEDILQDYIAQRTLSPFIGLDIVFFFAAIWYPIMLYGLPTLVFAVFLGLLVGNDRLASGKLWLGMIGGLLTSAWGVLNYMRIIVGDFDYGGSYDSTHNYISLGLFTIYFILGFTWSSWRLWRLTIVE